MFPQSTKSSSSAGRTLSYSQALTMSSYEKKTKSKTINKTTENIPQQQQQQMPTTRGTRGTNEKCKSVWSPPDMDGKSKTINKTTQNIPQQQMLSTKDKKQTESKTLKTPQQQQQQQMLTTRGTNEKCTTSVENWSPYMEGIMPEKTEHMSLEMEEVQYRRAFHLFVDDFLYNPNKTTRRLPIFEQLCPEEK